MKKYYNNILDSFKYLDDYKINEIMKTIPFILQNLTKLNSIKKKYCVDFSFINFYAIRKQFHRNIGLLSYCVM